MRTLLLSAVIALSFWQVPQPAACELAEPANEPVLTVDGNIANCSSDEIVRFDLPQIEKLPRQEIRTENPWEKGMVSYEGVALADLLAHVGARGSTLVITALNDYKAEMDYDDALTTGVILAYKRNGSYMPVREKGPLFVVFPFSDQPALNTEARFAQSVWQVSRITLK